MQWIEKCCGGDPVEGGFVDGLKSGVVLCKLANRLAKANGIKPEKGKKLIRKIKNGPMKFDQLENLLAFSTAMRTRFGMRESSTPSPNDVNAGKNLRQIEMCLSTLRRDFGAAVEGLGGGGEGPVNLARSN